MADYPQIAYDYCKAEGKTSSDVRAMTPAEFRTACGVSLPLPMRFKQMRSFYRRRLAQRLGFEERATGGIADAVSLQAMARSAGWPNATAEFVDKMNGPIQFDGPAVVVRRNP